MNHFKNLSLTPDRGGIASCIRFKYIPKLANASLTFFADAQNIAIWSTVEPGLGIMAGCLATLRPLFRTFLRSALTYAQHGRSAYGTDKSTITQHNRSHSNVEDDAVLFSNPTYLKGNSIDAGHRIPKEPWRPGGKFAQRAKRAPAANGVVNEGIEMDARMVEEAAHIYDTSRIVSNRPTAPDAAYQREYYV
jgi:hypothetical protein